MLWANFAVGEPGQFRTGGYSVAEHHSRGKSESLSEQDRGKKSRGGSSATRHGGHRRMATGEGRHLIVSSCRASTTN